MRIERLWIGKGHLKEEFILVGYMCFTEPCGTLRQREAFVGPKLDSLDA